MAGTRVEVEVVRVIDGDTLRVKAPEGEESLRILSLDTEESNAGSSKPVTPWGQAAKQEAERLFQPGDTVTLEFPGNEPPEVCWQKYRGNYGRPLVFVYLADGRDYQEYMIRNGYSPYFVKYGYAEHEANHLRYLAAEQMAQADNVGVWNQLVVNGTEARNYALLSVWWYLRAEVIQGYRRFKQQFPEAVIYNTRSDYQTLLELSSEASEAANVTIFTELREPRRLGSNMLIGIGAVKQPFNIFIPDVDLPERRAVLSGIMNRYVATDDVHPRRSYAYVTGRLKQYRGTPEMVVTDLQQITDYPPTT